MRKSIRLFFPAAVLFLCAPFFASAAAVGDVVIHEIAWMGTKASSADEWVELKNTTPAEIDLSGWGLFAAGGNARIIALTGKIAANGYYLIERTDDTAVADISADEAGPFGGSGLSNAGEYLVLKDNAGNTIDALDFSSGWPAGVASPDYASMERSAEGWHTNDGVARNGTDAKGNPIRGTPRAQNSARAAQGAPSSAGTVLPSAQAASPTASPASSSASAQYHITADAGSNAIALAGDEVSFDGAQSSGGQGILSFSWNMGDGTVKEGKTVTHRYQFPGIYTVVLTVSDGARASQDRSEAIIYAKGVMISEFLPLAGADETQWIELYNANRFFIDVSGWKIQAGKGSEAFSIPRNTFIAGGGWLVFSAQTMRAQFPSSGAVSLLYPTGQTAHEVAYESARGGMAVARADDGAFAWTESPTPGGRNIFVSFQDMRAASSSPAAVSARAAPLPEKKSATYFMPLRETAAMNTDDIARVPPRNQPPVLPVSGAALAARAFPWRTYLLILAAVGISFAGLTYAKSRVMQHDENE